MYCKCKGEWKIICNTPKNVRCLGWSVLRILASTSDQPDTEQCQGIKKDQMIKKSGVSISYLICCQVMATSGLVCLRFIIQNTFRWTFLRIVSLGWFNAQSQPSFPADHLPTRVKQVERDPQTHLRVSWPGGFQSLCSNFCSLSTI